MNEKVDSIIVGQGLAGSVLAMELVKRGKSVYVFDEPGRNRASSVSAGICNPLTGRTLTKTWLADQLFPFLQSWYAESEKILGGSFFNPLPVYRPFLSQAEQQQWEAKPPNETPYDFVKRIWKEPYVGDRLKNPFGGLELSKTGTLDVARWITAVRSWLLEEGMFHEGILEEGELEVGPHIKYRDVSATRIIFCHGLAARDCRWFRWLPVRPLKGETITMQMNFPRDMIVNRGFYLVPTSTLGTFVAGSTYEHAPFSEGPSDKGLRHITGRLEEWFNEPFEVIHQDWGIRPTVSDRRPLLGSHPEAQNVVIFSGLGTKGVSLAPYFASSLVDWIEGKSVLPEVVNISRFMSLYSN